MNDIKNIAGILLVAGLFFSVTHKLQAQNNTNNTAPTLKELLRDNRHFLTVENGQLKGEGGDWLRREAKEADVVVLGETHASKEIPTLISALVNDLQEADEFDYLAIEVSPWTSNQLTDQLQKGKQAYNRFIKKYPVAVPFYNFKTERDLLYQVVQQSDHAQPLWGLDQIFAFSTNLAFNRLETLAPSDSVESYIQQLRKARSKKVADDPRLQQLPDGIPTPITVYEPSSFDTLKAQFQGINEAQQIIAELSKSIKIYRLNDQNNYASNQVRARYLRNNLRHSFREAQKDQAIPKIVIKVGARHAYRGITPNNALDVGNLAVSMARSMGGEALNVAVLCGPGSKGLSFPAQTTDCWPSYLGSELETLSKNKPVLFDLTAVHPQMHESNIEISDQLEAFLWGFDAVIIIPNTRPAEPIAAPGSNSK